MEAETTCRRTELLNTVQDVLIDLVRCTKSRDLLLIDLKGDMYFSSGQWMFYDLGISKHIPNRPAEYVAHTVPAS